MVLRRRRVLLVCQQLLEIRLLAGRRLKPQGDCLERQPWVHRPPIVRRQRLRIHVAFQRDTPAVLDGRNAIPLRPRRGRQQKGNQYQGRSLFGHMKKHSQEPAAHAARQGTSDITDDSATVAVSVKSVKPRASGGGRGSSRPPARPRGPCKNRPPARSSPPRSTRPARIRARGRSA